MSRIGGKEIAEAGGRRWDGVCDEGNGWVIILDTPVLGLFWAHKSCAGNWIGLWRGKGKRISSLLQSELPEQLNLTCSLL